MQHRLQLSRIVEDQHHTNHCKHMGNIMRVLGLIFFLFIYLQHIINSEKVLVIVYYPVTTTQLMSIFDK